MSGTASTGILGFGTTLKYATFTTSGGVDTVGSYNAIAEVIDVMSPDPVPDDVEFTHMDSPDNYKEFRAGLVDGGEVTFELNFTKAEYTTLDGLRGTVVYWKETFIDGSTIVWKGYLKKLTVKAPIKDRVTAPATIRVTGKPTFTAGS